MTILHLKRCLKLSCLGCKIRLGKGHRFCPSCGKEINEAMKRQQEQRRMRTLPIDKQSLVMLKEYIVDKGITLGNDSRLIFDLNRHRAWQIVRGCARRASLPDLINPETGLIRSVSPHRLRDTFSVHAMKLNDSGDGLRLLQEHLGHASFDTTAKYRKIAGDEHRKWYDRLWDQGA